jgi:lipopolysaccharide export LptBFGC system permease protein LptF
MLQASSKLLGSAIVVLAALSTVLSFVEPALAQVAVPGPLVGAGLPALVILGGGYWLIRKLRKRRESN